MATENWFASTTVADDLLRRQFTLLRSLRKEQTRYYQSICLWDVPRSRFKFVWVEKSAGCGVAHP